MVSMSTAAEKLEQAGEGATSAATPAGHSIPKPTPQLRLPDVPADRLPRSIAIIMDGNGRWAVERGLPRMHGHKTGAQSVRAVVTECAHLGLDALTLYSFSIENWKRPEDEVDFLMSLYEDYLIAERQEMIDNNIRFIQCGRRLGLPVRVLEELDRTIDATRHCSGLKLVLAINYGSRAEITDAVKAIASKVAAGAMRVEEINEETIRSHLYVPELPDPDLLIRTAGEMRISNYLLWQISYAELYVTKTLWPDFGVEGLRAAIRDYASRHRRFGGIDQSNT